MSRIRPAVSVVIVDQAGRTPGGAAASAPVRLPMPRLRSRARNHLRRLHRRWRQVFPRQIPAWAGPDVEREAEEPALRQSHDDIEISAESVTRAWSVLESGALSGRARRLTLVVTAWRSPWPGWSGRLGPVPGLVAHTVSLPAASPGTATISVTVADPTPAHVLLDAALAVVDPARALPAPVTPETVVEGGRPPWLRAGAIHAGGVSRIPRLRVSPESGRKPDDPGAVPAEDVHLHAPPMETAETTSGLIWTRYGASGPGDRERVLVDAAAANPVGRGIGQDLRDGVLSLVRSEDGTCWWRMHSSDRKGVLVAAGRAGDRLDDRQRSALLRLRSGVLTRPAEEVPDAAFASVLAQLAMTGLVVHASRPPEGVTALLARDLAGLVEAGLPGAGDDPITWELRSIAQRRAALRGHASGLVALPIGSADPDGAPAAHRGAPSVTAVLLTRRPGRVEGAVADLVAQTYPNLEIIVGVHGVELDAGQLERLKSGPVPVEVLALPATLTLGEALAAATGAASGTLLTKVDDDDRYGPEHIWDLVLARHYSGATVVGKPAEFVHVEAYDATVRRRMAMEQYTDTVAGATILIGRGDLEAVGGWRPLARAVDRALLDRVLRAGGLIYRTHGFGFVCGRHGDRHTWDPGSGYFLLNPLRHWPGLPPFAEFVGSPEQPRPADPADLR